MSYVSIVEHQWNKTNKTQTQNNYAEIKLRDDWGKQANSIHRAPNTTALCVMSSDDNQYNTLFFFFSFFTPELSTSGLTPFVVQQWLMVIVVNVRLIAILRTNVKQCTD